MFYLADTMALVWYLRGHRRLGKQARKNPAGSRPRSSYYCDLRGDGIMEILYLSERRRISISLENLDNLLAQSANYMVVPIGFEVVKAAAGIDDVRIKSYEEMADFWDTV